MFLADSLGREQTFTTSPVKGFPGEVQLTQERNLYQKATVIVKQFTSEVNRPSFPSLFHHGVHVSHCSNEQWEKWTCGFTSEGGGGLFCLRSETFHWWSGKGLFPPLQYTYSPSDPWPPPLQDMVQGKQGLVIENKTVSLGYRKVRHLLVLLYTSVLLR